ncbi:MAG TPA: ABC transporter ATP-binding protein [candidate division CPR3 bacterium]|uniref:ABC transporter ATP-binding protein n=1 Tax=candidate division CPR3 bacterium TaxID=2268181 RepID=A0A7C1NMC2_UNCC3|nr:ABC transporter ATP-binding protein [candidate division CPR3 bacterium]
MALLEVQNLTKIYKNDEGVETPALQGVSFEIKKGEFVAIMGASGSGKSTLLHILGFLDHQTDGEYRFDGRTIHEYSEADLAHMRNEKLGFIFQAFNLLPRTSVLDNVKLPLLYSDIPEAEWNEKVVNAIESVELSHRMEHEPSQLSGGEKQRVAIARALVNNPQIIFADEPTGNLDSKSGKAILEILQKLNKQGHTVVLITHETFIGEYTKRIIRLYDGKIINS